jgi:hypothetical protein
LRPSLRRIRRPVTGGIETKPIAIFLFFVPVCALTSTPELNENTVSKTAEISIKANPADQAEELFSISVFFRKILVILCIK